MPNPTQEISISAEDLAVILAQARSDFLQALPEARAGLLVCTQPTLAPLRRLFHNLSGLMPSLGMRTLGVLARVGEELVVLLPSQPTLLPLIEGLLEEVITSFASLETPSPQPQLRSSNSGVKAAPEWREPVSDTKAKRTVLVVDDDKASGHLVQASLTHLDLHVVLCTSSDQALEMMEREQPSLMILDVFMPGVDGFELCARIRAHANRGYMPILFLSAATDIEARVRGLSVGGDDFLPKPFEPTELAARVSSHLQRVATMRELSIRDALTGLFNRGHFDEQLHVEMRRSMRTSELFALAILDVDHFKMVNDEFGHQTGDAVLVHIARLLRAQFRGSDIISRFGGEEFTVILVRTHGELARQTVERACAQIAKTPYRSPANSSSPVEVRLTVSAGLATFFEGESHELLIGRADRALYAAKHSGRNRVVSAELSGGVR